MSRHKKIIENLSDDKLESIKSKLMSASNNADATATQVILRFKPEITKLRREKVSLNKICDILKSEEIDVSVSLLRHVLGPLNKRKKNVENQQQSIQEQKKTPTQIQPEKPLNTTKNVEVKSVVTQKPATPKPAAGVTSPGFAIPDLGTLPAELTSIPGFDPASTKTVNFVDKNGKKMIYMKGRLIPDPDQHSGPVNTFTLDKHKSLNSK